MIFFAGSLYYGTEDRVAPDEILWNQKSLENARNFLFETQESEAYMTEDVLNRLNNFNIDAKLALSFLGGLVEIGGSAKYLDDREETKNSGEKYGK